jgi:hypothetical protein
VGSVDIGVAEPRRFDLDDDLARSRLGLRPVLDHERLFECAYDGCFHQAAPF